MIPYLMGMEAPPLLIWITVIFFAAFGIAMVVALVRHYRAGGSIYDLE